MKIKIINVSALVLLSAAITVGCGGSGSNDPAPATPASVTPTPAPVTPPTAPPAANNDTPEFSIITSSSGLSHQWDVSELQTFPMPKRFSSGLAVGDFDQDGDQDVFVHGGDQQAGKLFQNQGNNTFVDITSAMGLDLPNHLGSGASFVDLDGDTWLDLFVGGIAESSNYLFKNNQGQGFVNVTGSASLNITVPHTVSASFADYDKDGHIDMALSHWGSPVSQNGQHIWRNLGGMRFESVNTAVGLTDTIINPDIQGAIGEADYTFTPNFGDFNNDGFIDLAFVGDFATTQFYTNNNNGSFNHATTNIIDDQNGMGSAVADYDNDGDLDWFVTSIYPYFEVQTNSELQGNRLYQNQGDGTFVNVTDEAGVINGRWGWGACFADFNNDGFLDIFHTGGWGNPDELPTNPQRDFSEDLSRLLINKKDGTFTEKAMAAGLTDTRQGRGVSCFDSDNDGDIDILVNNNSRGENALVFYQNDTRTSQGNYLAVDLQGKDNNTQALGARVYLTVGDITQMREVNSNSNFASQNPTRLHFGLGDNTQADSIRIVWPDGTETVQSNVQGNQLLTF